MTLSRDAIVEGLQAILGPEHVVTDEEVLKRRSIDNFRKLETIFGTWTLPPPAAVALVGGTEDVAAVLAFANEHGINVVPRTGGTGDRGRSRDACPGLDRHRRRPDEPDRERRSLRHAGDGAVRRAAAGARGRGAQARPHDGTLAAVEAGRAHGRPRRDAQHRPVLDALRRHRGHGRRARGRLPGRATWRGSRTSRAAPPGPTSATS